MENLFIYLLKASLCMALFYTVYLLFLRRETLFRINRFYLLFSLLMSVLLPALPLQYPVTAIASETSGMLVTISESIENMQSQVAGSAFLEGRFSWKDALFLIYFSGLIIFLSRLLWQVFVLLRLIFKNKIKRIHGIRILENNQYGTPFSFFNIVFINPDIHKTGEVSFSNLPGKKQTVLEM